MLKIGKIAAMAAFGLLAGCGRAPAPDYSTPEGQFFKAFAPLADRLIKEDLKPVPISPELINCARASELSVAARMQEVVMMHDYLIDAGIPGYVGTGKLSSWTMKQRHQIKDTLGDFTAACFEEAVKYRESARQSRPVPAGVPMARDFTFQSAERMGRGMAARSGTDAPLIREACSLFESIGAGWSGSVEREPDEAKKAQYAQQLGVYKNGLKKVCLYEPS